MEKGTAHYSLRRIRELVAARRLRMTHTARAGANALGLGGDGVLEVLLGLEPSDFYKSMTTYADHTEWQDVYRPMTRYGAVYLKLIVIDDVLVVSFKAR